jgi:hypothetical protein
MLTVNDTGDALRLVSLLLLVEVDKVGLFFGKLLRLISVLD